jgi:hypothetical protein
LIACRNRTAEPAILLPPYLAFRNHQRFIGNLKNVEPSIQQVRVIIRVSRVQKFQIAVVVLVAGSTQLNKMSAPAPISLRM